MTFAFSGSHRSGKTTLARAVAEEMKIHFHETRTGDVMRELGINIVGNMDLAQRVEVQEKLLAHHLKTIQELPRPLIVDRSPLDMFAYMLAEVNMHTLAGQPELDARVQAYLAHCTKLIDVHYAGAVICHPLPVYVDEPGKPPASRAYQRHIHSLIVGCADDCNYLSSLHLEGDDFETRKREAIEFIGCTLAEMSQVADSYYLH